MDNQIDKHCPSIKIELPLVTYIPEGDCLEIVLAEDNYYAERINGLVTIYYSEHTDKIVGLLIKGIQAKVKGEGAVSDV